MDEMLKKATFVRDLGSGQEVVSLEGSVTIVFLVSDRKLGKSQNTCIAFLRSQGEDIQ